MSIAKTVKHSPSLSCLHSSLLCLLLVLLSGCSTNSVHTDATPAEDSTQVKPLTTDAPKSTQTEPKKEHHKDNLDENSSPSLCVYETIKGIAEVTEITESVVTFKFYPGDKYFKIHLNHVPSTEIKLEQELKAIARSPISGPCKSVEFELLTAIE